jgi:fatty-acid peroxygenase
LTSNVTKYGEDGSYVARMLGRRALVVWGAEGARLFYDSALVQRAGAMPPPLARLLFGRGAVHGLDDTTHAARKALFLHAVDESRVESLVKTIGADLAERVESWPGRGELSVFDELVGVYGTNVISWAGIELSAEEARRRSHDLARIVDGFGGAGVAAPRGAAARRRSNRWASELVRQVRRGRTTAPPGSALELLAVGAGADLDDATAGVELLNILRPTVAVAWLGTFGALALDRYPEWQSAVARDDHGVRHAFAQEVRRTAPFAPALAARVRVPAVRRGVRLKPGDFVVLDLLSTNHDAARWPDPVRFDPSRFLDGDPGPYDLVPQGGGPQEGHRCPGEPLTLGILEETLGVVAAVPFTVSSDPSYDPQRIPALPGRGLRVRVGD